MPQTYISTGLILILSKSPNIQNNEWAFSIFAVVLNSYLLTASFNACPAENEGALQAAILIVSPVRWFLPSLAFLSDTLKEPKPMSCTCSPFFKEFVISSKTASIVFFVSVFVNPVVQATASIVFDTTFLFLILCVFSHVTLTMILI